MEILNFISHTVKWLREENLVIHAEAAVRIDILFQGHVSSTGLL